MPRTRYWCRINLRLIKSALQLRRRLPPPPSRTLNSSTSSTTGASRTALASQLVVWDQDMSSKACLGLWDAEGMQALFLSSSLSVAGRCAARGVGVSGETRDSRRSRPWGAACGEWYSRMARAADGDDYACGRGVTVAGYNGVLPACSHGGGSDGHAPRNATGRLRGKCCGPSASGARPDGCAALGR
ncbi:hypothetical protein K438DRAFT_1784538 [Mycena galopus ATCC 62051]|nr:hypothetical protein K438DRAFT_1784538 [Mycena galopus ATCC 62051]